MIFQTAGAINKILRCEKTQTRRIVKPEHRNLITWLSDGKRSYISEVYNDKNDKPIYQLGKTYGVQPGRGKPTVHFNPVTLETNEEWLAECRENGMDTHIWGNAASLVAGYVPLRIRILTIRREDVRNISNEDVRAEGYPHARDFLHAWCAMHDPALERTLWGEVKLMARPDDYYQAWALTFEIAG